MAFTQIHEPESYTQYRSDGSVYDGWTSSHVRKSQSKSDPARGQWITFPNGSKFRRATNYNVSTLEFQSGAAEVTSYSAGWGYYNRVARTSPGGFTDGNYTSPNWAFQLKDEMGISSINSPPDFDNHERNEAVTKSLNKLADSKANVGENLATFGETVRLFANPIKGLVSLIKKVREDKSMFPLLDKSYRAIYREGLDKRIAGQYLAYVYGLKPLMQDIFSLAEFLKEQAQGPLLLSSRASARRELSATDKYQVNGSYGRGENWHSIHGSGRTNVSLTAKLSDQFSGTRAINQLGLLNPASLVWELVPFSFAVDWVLPIGPVLQALTATAGLDFVDGSVSRRVNAQWETADQLIESPGQGRFITNSTPGTGKFSYDGYSRYKLDFWPRPGIWFDPDPLRLASSGSDRVLKALALSIVTLRGPR